MRSKSYIDAVVFVLDANDLYGPDRPQEKRIKGLTIASHVKGEFAIR